jgi:hypothetical protein
MRFVVSEAHHPPAFSLRFPVNFHDPVVKLLATRFHAVVSTLASEFYQKVHDYARLPFRVIDVHHIVCFIVCSHTFSAKPYKKCKNGFCMEVRLVRPSGDGWEAERKLEVD